MDNFLTWEVLKTYANFLTIVFTVVEFTKEIKVINKVPTKYWSFIVAFVLLISTNVATKTFNSIDMVLYALDAVMISLGANGLSNFNKNERKVEK